MRRCLAKTLPRLAALLRRDEGTASMEFVLVVPLLVMVFMASFESGLLMVRSILLEQSVDMTMRELRLGHYGKITNQLLKREICSRTIIFPNCEADMKIELERVSTSDWIMPAEPTRCINRREEAEPVITMTAGQQNDLMLVRVCLAAEAMFPTTGLGLKLPLDADGAYGLIARTAFVIEPD